MFLLKKNENLKLNNDNAPDNNQGHFFLQIKNTADELLRLKYHLLDEFFLKSNVTLSLQLKIFSKNNVLPPPRKIGGALLFL